MNTQPTERNLATPYGDDLVERLAAVERLIRALAPLNERARLLQRDAVRAFGPLFVLRNRLAVQPPALAALFSILHRYLGNPLASDPDASQRRRALAEELRSSLDDEELQRLCEQALEAGRSDRWLATRVVAIIPEAHAQAEMAVDHPAIALAWREPGGRTNELSSLDLLRTFLDDERARILFAAEPRLAAEVRILARLAASCPGW
jgi:hypothetical protein